MGKMLIKRTRIARKSLILFSALSIIVLFPFFNPLWANELELLGSMTGESIGDQFGLSVSSAGDVNGDGYADIVVGADANDEGGTSAGKVYIYFGGSPLDSLPDVMLLGGAGDFFGKSVSSAGDVNGDGYADVLIGAHFNSDVAERAGKAFVFFGGSPMDTVPDVVMWGEREKDEFGNSVSSAGDVNGDGYDDIIVGAWWWDLIAGSDTLENTGKVYLYYGGPSMDNVADLTIAGKKEGERFGCSVSSAGDVNGDGYDDIIVGAYSYDSPTEINLGRAYIFYGGVAMDTLADVVLTGEGGLNSFGWSVAGAGRINSDQYDDVLVGAYGYNSEVGKSYIFYGGSPMDNLADLTMEPGESGANQFGFAVSCAGNLNSDSYDDLIVGAPGDDNNFAGKAYIYYGGGSMGSGADATFTGENIDDKFGYAVSEAGDIDDNGYDDLIIGACGYNSSTGKAYLYGNPQVVTDTIPPGRVTDLLATSASGNSISLRWTAPGDDGYTGTASLYDVRYSTSPLGSDTSAWWEAADTAIGEPNPQPAGLEETFELSGLAAHTRYYIALETADERPNWSLISNIVTDSTQEVGVKMSEDGDLPKGFSLFQNYPNPFNPTTLIRYQLSAVRGRPSAVTLRIYNIAGQLVRTLVDAHQPPGVYRGSWDGKDSLGHDVASGVYLCRLQVIGDGLAVERTRKIVLLR